MIRHLDLFSGIGGFALAAKMVGGIETVGFCEIEPWARKVLKKNFPEIPCHDDVKTLKGNEYGTIDLITGGYPCQPFSLAGKRKGQKDDRHLWPEVLRIIEKARPRMVLCENVAGHVSMGLDSVLSELESIAYTGEPLVIPACAVDAKHRRDRVWIIAYDDRAAIRHAEELIQRSESEAQPPHDGEKGLISNTDNTRQCSDDEKGGEKGDDFGICSKVLAAARGVRQPRQGAPGDAVSSETERKREATITRNGSERCERSIEPAVGRVAHGIPQRLDRLKGLGNAIVPQVAAEILRAMITISKK